MYFHEDSFHIVEFCPRENLKFLEWENGVLAQVTDEERTKYILNQGEVKLVDKRIDMVDFDTLVKNHSMVRFDKVYTGYGQSAYKSDNTVAYRFSGINHVAIFVRIKNDTVIHLWLDEFRFHESTDDKLKLRAVLLGIGNKFDLVLNDRHLNKVIDLKSAVSIDAYLNQR